MRSRDRNATIVVGSDALPRVPGHVTFVPAALLREDRMSSQEFRRLWR